ncbi:hypothetical protein [Natrialba aegyptia]|uniref:hypothetical protein n=1 Tax=Natrialba aegyptia TaxID=129789 RepID=UPI000A8A2ADD|nr:hypothetical protein [Natrialba aegyptia]
MDALVDEYRDVAKDGDGDLRMLKTLKIIRSILVIVAMSAIALYALYLGADPTLVAAICVPALAAIGSEAIDYAALVQGYLEARDNRGD